MNTRCLNPIPSMRRPPSAPFAAFLLAASLLGCTDTVKPGVTAVDLTAPFILSTVNGTELPYRELTQRFANGAAVSDSTIITVGSIAFESDLSLRLQFTMRQKRFQGAQVLSDVTTTRVYPGTWSLEGNEVTMSWSVDGVTHSAVGTVDVILLSFDDKETYYTSATQTAILTRSLVFSQ
jgi:hypothetical protein